jgi:hypothetical protein
MELPFFVSLKKKEAFKARFLHKFLAQAAFWGRRRTYSPQRT